MSSTDSDIPPPSPRHPLQRRVLHISGPETTGTVTELCRFIEERPARLLHIEQSLVRGSLSLVVEVEYPAQSNTVEDLEQWLRRRFLNVATSDSAANSRASLSCGVWVTVLGKRHSAGSLARVLEAMQSAGMTITRMEPLSDERLVGVNLLGCKESLSEPQVRQLRGRLLGLCPELHVDLAVQRDDVYRTNKRLLCMDVDSTFVKGEFIDDLAELCGVKEQVAAITARAMRGDLNFEGALRERVQLLKGLPMSRARELCDRFEVTPGADDLVRTVKRLGMRVGLVSGGFDFFVESLKERFGLDFAFANELGVEDGKLTGEVVGTVVTPARKAQVLKDMAHVFGIRLEQTIAAGDGANDIPMLQTAGLGIAYQAKPMLQQVADTCFNESERLDSLLYLMGLDARKVMSDFR